MSDQDAKTPINARRVLVVGASSGIGAAVARRLGATGARVVLTARRLDRLNEVAEGLPQALVLQADVCDEPAIRGVVDDAAAALRGLDAVVYAAATAPLRPMSEATGYDWRAVLETNVIGAAVVASAAAPHLVASGGRFVALSSRSVDLPFTDLGLYRTSKAALNALMRCLPTEFPGLQVTTVVVGDTHSTEFSSGWDPDAFDTSLARWVATGVVGDTEPMSPDEVARAIVDALNTPVHVSELAVVGRHVQAPPRP